VADDTAEERAEKMYRDYLTAGGLGVLGTVDYFREVAESAAAEADRG
jgi:hypothetical protein